MEYCCQIWVGAATSLLFPLIEFKIVTPLKGLHIFHSMAYFTQIQYCKSIDTLMYFTCQMFRYATLFKPTGQTFRARPCLSTPTMSNHPHFLYIPFIKRKVHSDSFSPRTTEQTS